MATNRYFKLSLAIGLAFGGSITVADMVHLDSGNRISSITDMPISGVTYDATMHHGITWLEYKGLSVTHITFPTSSDALQAANAISHAIQRDRSIAHLKGADDFLVPFADNGVSADVRALLHAPSLTYDRVPAFGINTVRDVQAINVADSWVSFSPVSIPEPNGFLLLCAIVLVRYGSSMAMRGLKNMRGLS